MPNCYRKGGCGPYEQLSCSECPASKADYLTTRAPPGTSTATDSRNAVAVRDSDMRILLTENAELRDELDEATDLLKRARDVMATQDMDCRPRPSEEASMPSEHCPESRTVVLDIDKHLATFGETETQDGLP